MKKHAALILVVAVVIGLCLVGCSSNSSSNTSNASENASTSSTASASAVPIKDGFDSSTNIVITVAGLQFQVPQYYAENTRQSEDGAVTYYYAERGSEIAMLMTQQAYVDIASSQVSKEKDQFFAGVMSSMNDAVLKSSSNLDLNGTPGAMAVITGEINGLPMTSCCVFFVNDDIAQMGVITLGQTDGTNFDYFPDFAKIVASAHKVTSSNETPQQSSLVSPELVEFLDSYEAFVDEYISFMERYSQSPSSLELLSELSTYMEKYSDLASAIEKYDADSMSPADAAYYLEVTTRVSKKLLSASL